MDVPFYTGDRRSGILRITTDGEDTVFEIEASCPTGLYRVYAKGEKQDLLLGVWEGGSMRRRFSRELTSPAGLFRSGMACPIGDGGGGWIPVQPEHFPGWPTAGGLCRRRRGVWQLALPFEPDGPFPLPQLFCFAVVCRVDGTQRAVFCFDDRAQPVMPSVF